MECPKCHKNISDNATVCPHCHKVLTLVCPNCRTLGQSPVCENCGYIILEKCSKCGRIIPTSSEKCKCGFPTATSIAYQECETDEFASLSIKFASLRNIRRILGSQDLYNKFKVRLKNLLISQLKGVEARIIVYGDTYVVNFNKELSFATSVNKAVRLGIKILNSFTTLNLKVIDELATPLKLNLSIVRKTSEELLTNKVQESNVKLLTVKKDEKRYLKGMQIVLDQYVQDNISKEYITDSLFSVEQNGESVVFYEIILEKYVLPPVSSNEEEPIEVKKADIKKIRSGNEPEDVFGFKIFDINAKCKFEKTTSVELLDIVDKNEIVSIRTDAENMINTSELVNFYELKGLKVIRAICTQEMNYRPWAVFEQLFRSYYNLPSHNRFLDSNFDVKIFEPIIQLLNGRPRKAATAEDARFAYMEDFCNFLGSLKNTAVLIEGFENADDTTIQTLELYFDKFKKVNSKFVFITNNSTPLHSKIKGLLRTPLYTEITLQETPIETLLSAIKSDASDFINSFYYEKLAENYRGSKLYFDNAIAFLKEKGILLSFENKLLIKSNDSVLLPIDLTSLLRARLKNLSKNIDASMILAYSLFLGSRLDIKSLETLEIHDLNKNIKLLEQLGFITSTGNAIYVNNYNILTPVIQLSVKPEVQEYLCKNILAKLGKGLDVTSTMLIMGKIGMFKEEYLLLWRNAQYSMALGDYDAYLKNCLGCLTLIEHVNENISEEDIENNKKEVYENILMSLYGYSPAKIYSIENVLLMDAIKENDNEKIVKLSNLMLQGALISSNYTDALTLLHNILTRMPNPTLLVDGAVNTRFLLLSLVNIEILFNIGDFKNCIEVADDLLGIIKPDIIEKIKPASFSTNLFVSHLMETFRLVAFAKLITMDSDLDGFFEKVKDALNSDMPEKDAIISLKEYFAGKSFVPSNSEDSTPFAKIIYLFLQEFETNKNNYKVLAQNVYQAKLLASDIHQSQLELFAELIIADCYAHEGAKHKAAIILNDIYQKAENSAIFNIVLLSKFFMARLEILKSDYEEAIQIVNDALALIQNNDNQAKAFYALFEKFFIDIAKLQNNSSIDIESEERKLEMLSPNGELKRLLG